MSEPTVNVFERAADLFETLVKVFETPVDLFDKAADLIKTIADLLKTDVHFFCAGADLPEMVADHFDMIYSGPIAFERGIKQPDLSVLDPLRNA